MCSLDAIRPLLISNQSFKNVKTIQLAGCRQGKITHLALNDVCERLAVFQPFTFKPEQHVFILTSPTATNNDISSMNWTHQHSIALNTTYRLNGMLWTSTDDIVYASINTPLGHYPEIHSHVAHMSMSAGSAGSIHYQENLDIKCMTRLDFSSVFIT